MQSLRILTGAVLLLLAAACRDAPEIAGRELAAASRSPAPMTVLRIPRDGGLAELYRSPGLDSMDWTAEEPHPALSRVIGASPEQALVFLLDRKRKVIGLDLETRRVRTFLEQVEDVTLGPDGALYAVDTGGTVTQLVRRTPVRFRSKLQGEPTALYATMDGTLLAHLGGPRPALEVLGSDQRPTAIPVAAGRVAVTYLGDLAAVAADTAVVLYSSDPKRQPLAIPVPGRARAVAFSPSGHRVYVGREADGVLVIDRYGHDVLAEVELPGPVRDFRSDLYGRWLLARPAQGDSIWVIDVGRGRYTGAIASPWTAEFPVIASPNTLLTRRGRDLVALDLAGQAFPETGRVRGGGSDLWIPIAWHPEGEPSLTEAADSAALAAGADSVGPAATVYLQVSSSRNPAWANELAGKLRGAGLPASVLSPKRSDEAFRVVLGPYASREQAEETGRRIGMPSFVVTAQDGPAE